MREEYRDINRSVKRRAEKEVPFSEISRKQKDEFYAKDKYPSDMSKFFICGFEVEIENDLLAEALLKLPNKGRDIVLLSYFFDMTDAEIAEKLHMIRQTVQ